MAIGTSNFPKALAPGLGREKPKKSGTWTISKKGKMKKVNKK